jgi:hypothetical protein
LDAYASLYADARKWLRSGWVDYMVPQLYWSIDSRGQSFPVLLEWWEDQNIMKRHLWAGLNTGKVGEAWDASEVINQIKLTRQFGLDGQVHYNIGEFQGNPTLTRQLKAGLYAELALTPRTPWLDSTPPSAPDLKVFEESDVRAEWTPGEGEKPWQWLLQTRRKATWKSVLLPGATQTKVFSQGDPEVIAVRAVDRCGNLSPPVVIRLKP